MSRSYTIVVLPQREGMKRGIHKPRRPSSYSYGPTKPRRKDRRIRTQKNDFFDPNNE